MFGTCSTSNCDKPSGLMSGHCNYHDAIGRARNLSVDEFDKLREALAVTAPVTDDERNVRHARYALASIERVAKDLRHYKQMARKHGATSAQVADAVRRGKSQYSCSRSPKIRSSQSALSASSVSSFALRRDRALLSASRMK